MIQGVPSPVPGSPRGLHILASTWSTAVGLTRFSQTRKPLERAKNFLTSTRCYFQDEHEIAAETNFS